ncbi:MAG: hypothetical protein FJ030_15490 [Chloroflexi bacterium]|nr:hypothetical protein [Chloroflexota bacterium]
MIVPLLMLAAPAIMSLAAYLLRRWVWAQSLIAALTSATLGLLALQIPLDQIAVFAGRDVQFQSAWVVLGRSFTFAETDRPSLAFIYLASTFFFAGAGAAKPPRAFLPVGLITLSLLAATIFAQPFLFAALFLEMIAASAAFILSDDEHPATRGALRLLVFVTLAVPFILLAGWQLEGLATSPEDTSLLVRATILLNIGLLILLAVVPFHSWIPNVADDSAPYASAFVFTVVQTAVMFFMLKFFTQFDWLRANTAEFAALRLAGAAMVGVGGAFAFAQRKFGRLMGYAVMVDLGTALLAVSIVEADGLPTALSIVALRGIGLAVWGMGLGWIRSRSTHRNSDDFDHVSGLGWQMPFAAAAVIVGGLSLAAIPLTAGFTGRWALFRLLARNDLTLAFVLLIASVSVTLAYARGIAALLRPPAAEESDAPREGQATIVFVIAGIGAIILLGMFPQMLLPAVARAAEAFVK